MASFGSARSKGLVAVRTAVKFTVFDFRKYNRKCHPGGVVGLHPGQSRKVCGSARALRVLEHCVTGKWAELFSEKEGWGGRLCADIRRTRQTAKLPC